VKVSNDNAASPRDAWPVKKNFWPEYPAARRFGRRSKFPQAGK